MKIYVIPFALYLAVSQIVATFPKHYAWLYPIAVLITGAVTAAMLWGRGVIRPHTDIMLGLAAGIVGIVLWIAICRLHPEERISPYLPSWLQPKPRPGFNPFAEFASPVLAWLFVTVRFIGLAILIPVVEELFWRGFLLRWLISSNWREQQLGQFTLGSFAGVTLLFTAVHPEWLAAAIYCALLNGLIYWKKDLWNCVVAHGVSNLILGIYILATGTWELW